MSEEQEQSLAWRRALKYLERRARTVKEVRDKLLEKKFDLIVVNKIVERLLQAGYLNDELFAQNYLRWRNDFRPTGLSRVGLDR